MKDIDKSKDELLKEIISLRQRVGELEQEAARCDQGCESVLRAFDRTQDNVCDIEWQIEQSIVQQSDRKQAEKELQRYQMLCQQTRDIVLYVSLDGQILEANEAAVKAYGYDRAQMLSLNITEIRAPQSHSLIAQHLAQAAERGILFETIHRRQDGSCFPVEVNSQSAVINNQKVILSVIRDITDRKQAEQEREQLLRREKAIRSEAQAAEQRARFLAEAGTVLSSSLDYEHTLKTVAHLVVPMLADWCVVDVFREGKLERLATAHVDPAKVEWGAEIYRRYPPNLNAPRGIANVLRTGQSELYSDISEEDLLASARDAEHLNILREMGLKSVMIVPLMIRERTLGAISFVSAESGHSYSLDDLNLAEELARRAAIALDNSRLYQEAQQAQRAAEKAADRTRRLQAVTAALSELLAPSKVAEAIVDQSLAALEASSGMMVLVTEDGTELEIVRAVGYDSQLVEPWRRFSINAPFPLAEAVRTGQPVWAEPLATRIARYPHLAELYAKYECEAWISLPLVVEGRSVGGLSLSFKQFQEIEQDDRDFLLALTRQCAQAIARAQLYESERQARTEAENANRVKDEFLAVLSHELRSPLNPILGWVRLLRQHQFDPQTTDKALETIERNAKLQAQLIEDLLDVSCILRGKIALNPSPLDLANTLDAALETVRLSAEAKSIAIHTFLEPNVGKILGDSNRLQQVVWNLVSNAIKFTPSGGRVEVRVERVDSYAQIQVKDTGIGINAEFLPFVFEYFRQQNSTTTRKFGGLGLGLAIVHYLVELHGGTVKAESPGEGLGSTFTVRLPLWNYEGAGVSFDSENSDGNSTLKEQNFLDKVRILIVDDEPDIRELVGFVLEQTGAFVTIASSAAEVMAALNQSLPDLFLCDIGMPDIDGYTLIRQIRALPPERGGKIPAIALTAYAGEHNKQQALAAGFHQHVSKPVEPDELVKVILELIGRI